LRALDRHGSAAVPSRGGSALSVNCKRNSFSPTMVAVSMAGVFRR